MDVTIFDYLFGTPERVADFVIGNCTYDCLSCPFNETLCDYGDCMYKEQDQWRAGILKRLSSSPEM